MMKILKSKKGEGSYVSTAVFILIAVIFISLTLNLFAVIHAKQQLDTCADQLTRQIQLAGEVNGDTDALFNAICGNIGSVSSPEYTVSTTYLTGRKIQYGTVFTVTITADSSLGGFGDMPLFPVHLVSSGSGVSEEFWK